jgi:hypothetical protein
MSFLVKAVALVGPFLIFGKALLFQPFLSPGVSNFNFFVSYDILL